MTANKQGGKEMIRIVLEQGREIALPEKVAAWLSHVAEAAGVSISTYVRDYLVPAEGKEKLHVYERFTREGGVVERREVESCIISVATRQCTILKSAREENKQLTEKIIAETPKD